MVRLSCPSEKFLLILASFFEGVVDDMCCSGMFEIWSKCVTEIFQEGDKTGPRVSQGRPISVQGGTPGGSEKEVANTACHSGKGPSKRLQNGNSNLKVWRILEDMFNALSESLFG